MACLRSSFLLTACFLSFILWLGIRMSVLGQGVSTTDVAALLEERLPWADSESASQAQLDAWILALSHPLNINQASFEELSTLQVLSPQEIEALIRHREQFGALVSLYELQAIWALSTIDKVIPFLTLVPNPTDGQPLWQRILREDRRYLLLRYDTEWPRSSAPTDSMSGGYGRWLGRLRISQTRDFSVGLTFDQDAGEPWAISPKRGQWGPDHLSAHVMGYGKGGYVKRWVVGDYQVHWGQGLGTAAGFSPGKGGETVLSTRRPSRGLLPYTSSVEAGYYRGGAITLGTDRLELTVLASHQRRDATVVDEDSTQRHFSALRSDGFHRTYSEQLGQNAARESSVGMMVQYASRYQKQVLGAYGLVHHWNHPWQPRLRPDNVHVFRGQTLPILGVFGQWRWRNLMVFGEGAISELRKPAGIVGAQLHVSQAWQLAWVARYYSPGFTTLYGDAFAEASQPRNERGLYCGVTYQPSKRWKIAAYYDRFSFPWLRFQASAPSQGYEVLARVQYRPLRHLTFVAQARREVKARNAADTLGVVSGTKDNALLQVNYRPEGALGLRIRAQGSRYQLGTADTYGVALMYDGFYERCIWKLSGRVAVFHAPDFDNRQYAYENHVLYAFALPAYYGRGVRTYLNFRIKPVRTLTLDARWARTFREATTPTEAAPDPITSLTVQVRYQF